mmetsp:Transcript_5571/g.9338  ORF Transcript_5571/g.9338 Transcript_5571/m.9338 type:complete len:347 (-) Transcript_5571:173-1213(-)
MLALWASACAQTAPKTPLFEAPFAGGKSGMCSSQGSPPKEFWLISVPACESKCVADPQCLGYEFAEFLSDHRGYKRCLLHLSKITHSIPAYGFTCMRRKNAQGNAQPGLGLHTNNLALPATYTRGSVTNPVSTSWTPASSSFTNPVIRQPTGFFGPGFAAGANAMVGAQPIPSTAPECRGVKVNKNCGCCMFLSPGVDLTVMNCFDLRGADLRRANLAGAQLEGADLTCANLDNANVKGVLLNNAIGIGSTWRGAQAEGLDMEQSNLKGADFSGANMIGAKAERAQLDAAKFDGSNIEGAVFIEASLTGTTFTGAKGMHKAIFEFTNGGLGFTGGGYTGGGTGWNG